MHDPKPAHQPHSLRRDATASVVRDLGHHLLHLVHSGLGAYIKLCPVCLETIVLQTNANLEVYESTSNARCAVVQVRAKRWENELHTWARAFTASCFVAAAQARVSLAIAIYRQR